MSLTDVDILYATGRTQHAWVILFLFCASGFSLLSLKHSCYGHECGMDVRPGFGSFSMRYSLFTETICTEQLRITRHLRYFDRFIRRKKKGYTYSRLPYHSNHVSTINIEFICCHGDIHPHPGPQTGHRNLRVSSEGNIMAYANPGQMYLSFTSTQGVWLTRLISWN